MYFVISSVSRLPHNALARYDIIIPLHVDII